MMNVKYIDNGKKVVIPVELWETFKDIFENIQLNEIVQDPNEYTLAHGLNRQFAKEGQYRVDEKIKKERNKRLMKIYNESKGSLAKGYRFSREEIHG